jgi:isoquinoline 1-oxidoreductase subunit beta
MKTALTRRAVLKGSAAAGAGLVLGFRLPLGGTGSLPSVSGDAMAQSRPGVFAPNQWLTIDRDGLVTITNSVAEMGQGSSTTMAMIVADELDVDLDKIRLEQAPANPALYANPATGNQSYGGSRSIRDHLTMWRKAGAAGREMLRQAAAAEWGVPVDSVDTEPGVAVHKPTGRRLPYASLVDRARQLPVPQNPKLKTPDRFRYMTKSFPRLDAPAKTDGRAIFGLDVKVPGMLVASIERCPVVAKGKVKSFDASAARQVKGVKDVVQVSRGVAVVASDSWSALKGRKALKVEWDEGPIAGLSSADIRSQYAALAKQPGLVARKIGDAEAAIGAGGKIVEAVYEVPFLDHACMEPMNATAHVTDDACVVWAPTQNPGGTQAAAAKLTGLSLDKVTVHTTMLGGGFGRRGAVDYVVDALEVSKAVRAPVKVVWTREDDMQHGFYRPATYNVFRAALDSQGRPTAWMHRIVGPGIQIQRGNVKPGAVDPSSVSVAADLPYDIPNLLVETIDRDLGVPVGSWRSVGASQNAFITESFIDELAHMAGKDPYEYRRALLGSWEQSTGNREIVPGALGKAKRHRAVLELAATKAGWGAPLPPGRGRGIAVASSFGSYAAHVAEVSVAPDGTVRVHRFVSAIDCGLAINPDQVKSQIEGAVVFALTAALFGEITLERGRVQQSNFHDYRMMKIGETPVTEVHLLDSGEAAGGIGEPGVPPTAPALCNAIFAATGKRIRKLPIRPDELKHA